ncbi:hypothetical protein [uncultured Erythrobacter sp.]|uniref:hypothetical protein n=1 Tax=uncultured Erythrobacter sp. TaxID=263913 RepID=UPI002621B9D9|nr:hypothetical protein [uncultured Erythrobacter sp.]
MRERRALRLTERQTILARIARRDAMTALADTLDEEAKSASLAERSRAMAREYGQRAVTGVAADLRELSALASGLASLAKDADNAREDARQQADWQVETLAETESRLKRLEERGAEARRAVMRSEELRKTPIPEGMAKGMAKGMARKLHRPEQTSSRTKR